MIDEIYEVILDHYKNPRNYGEIEKPDIEYEGGNPYCGDEIKMQFKIKDGVIEDVKFRGKGCAISQAAASILTEYIKGKKVEDLRRFTKKEHLENLGLELSPIRMKCALLSYEVLKIALFGEEEIGK
ncbi:MAG: Fe-S cluster assembly sulfur transfer protein SufU [Candidatus Hydrothermales bacterium]